MTLMCFRAFLSFKNNLMIISIMLDRILMTRHFHNSSSFQLQNKSVYQHYVCEFSRKHLAKHR